MYISDFQRRTLKYAHNTYIRNLSLTDPDRLLHLISDTPTYNIGTIAPKYDEYPYMHITQRNILILLHKLGVRYK